MKLNACRVKWVGVKEEKGSKCSVCDNTLCVFITLGDNRMEYFLSNSIKICCKMHPSHMSRQYSLFGGKAIIDLISVQWKKD